MISPAHQDHHHLRMNVDESVLYWLDSGNFPKRGWRWGVRIGGVEDSN